jgi:hypothetical protein
MNRMMLGLVAVFVLGSSLALLGCGGDDCDCDDITTIDANSNNAALLGGKAFTFADGTAIVITPAGIPTVLTFNSTATRFNLSTGTFVATGAVTFSSINLIVGNSTAPTPTVPGSTFPAASAAAAGKTITFTATFDNTTGSITVTTASGGTITSAPGVSTTPTGTGGFGGGA